MTTLKSKVYIQIVNQLRTIIQSDSLQPGDKLPSERELASRLQVGRSSVREALRSLELLGIIETRRGEGTYLKDFHDHHLVRVLGTFILGDKKALTDMLALNELLEIDAIHSFLDRNKERLPITISSQVDNEREWMEEILRQANNFLKYRIWVVLNEYIMEALSHSLEEPTERHRALLDAINDEDRDRVDSAYEYISLKRLFKKF
ncbi:GntR family transcriptional regulator [Bacillus carboniphilus]|uniref:GntR family transcriptional regulator n=1 Tax=Bacillus carboniphilus TaxID=86663 RepID=A0ABY9JXQ2_9BACI|nr:GntR family transcriptional regulator [Bacillus carboniphilus]WLR44169.1 GntR family transcriptional regulator [Bacillus carboniphilus]